MAPANQHELLPPPADYISSLAYAPHSSTRLLVSCWDRNVYLYETHTGEEGNGHLVAKYPHRAPVLKVCFGEDDNEAFYGGTDGQVKRIDLETGDQSILSEHSKAANCVVYSKEHSLLVSSSWDGTLHLHNSKNPSTPPTVITLPEKIYALSTSPTKLVAAMSNRLVYIFDLPEVMKLISEGHAFSIKPWQQRESSLKFMTRAVACMPNDAGYASSSIEGRVAVEWFDSSAESQARKYAFKCHRHEIDGVDVVYPVHALAFHPLHGTFASGGQDGFVALWDAVAKRRIRQYQKNQEGVAALAFSSDGKCLAVGVCPGMETDGGPEEFGDGRTHIYIRELGDTEAKGKGPKA